jgi:hypothetical protein
VQHSSASLRCRRIWKMAFRIVPNWMVFEPTSSGVHGMAAMGEMAPRQWLRQRVAADV